MKLLEKLEKKIIFNITRWFALFISCLGGLALIAGLLFFYKSSAALFPQKPKASVSAQDIEKSLSEDANSGNVNARQQTENVTDNLSDSKENEMRALAKQVVEALQTELSPESLESAKEEALKITLNKASKYPENVAKDFLQGLRKIVQGAPAGKKIAY